MTDENQYKLPLISHQVGQQIIRQRAKDGYINATSMCHAAGREWRRYSRLDSTKEYVAALEAATSIRSSELIQTLTGGDPKLQGTWVHPQVAIHLGQWLSPDFAVQVSKWVFDWLSGETTTQSYVPDFVQRFHLNSDRISTGYFSVINELFIRMYGRLERLGYRLPDRAPDGKRLRPDVSVGKRFSSWLTENHPDIDGQHGMYSHGFTEGYEFEAREYPNHIWPYFIEFVDTVWIPSHATDYFRGRDSTALEFIPRLLPPPVDDDC